MTGADMSSTDHGVIRTPDGRELEVLVEGANDGLPLVLQHGTPFSAVPYGPASQAAATRDVRLISYSRPGYSVSTPRPGRAVADVAADVATVVDVVAGPGSRFVTLGWSGGGPHAVACAALLADRCAAAATLAGVAPCDTVGLDWMAGMGEENQQEFGAALTGVEALEEWLAANSPGYAEATADELAGALGDLVSAVDVASLTGDFADYLARAFRRALSHGTAGWRDDDLSFVRDWGFDLASITVPVSIWQGAQDRMVPFAHGVWMAEHVGTARPHLYDDEGHLSLFAQIGRIFDDLLHLAGR
jgi:pimeloyl-ACP methyl ester carboxylesterase